MLHQHATWSDGLVVTHLLLTSRTSAIAVYIYKHRLMNHVYYSAETEDCNARCLVHCVSCKLSKFSLASSPWQDTIMLSKPNSVGGTTVGRTCKSSTLTVLQLTVTQEAHMKRMSVPP
jgi:hypothetical protein